MPKPYNNNSAHHLRHAKVNDRMHKINAVEKRFTYKVTWVHKMMVTM
jgi:hypothetical protein